MPRQVNGQCREIQHHPTEYAGDELGVLKEDMVCKVWMRACWIRQCCERNTCCNQPRSQHAGDEYVACLSVKLAAFLTCDRNPDRDESYGPRNDVHDHQRFENAMGRQAHFGAPYCA